jgi:hypothetical protein
MQSQIENKTHSTVGNSSKAQSKNRHELMITLMMLNTTFNNISVIFTCLSQNPINLFANKSSWIVLLVVCSACSAGCLRGRRGHDRMLVPIPLRRGVLDTSLCDKVCQWLEAGRWFSLGTPVSPTDKTDR